MSSDMVTVALAVAGRAGYLGPIVYLGRAGSSKFECSGRSAGLNTGRGAVGLGVGFGGFAPAESGAAVGPGMEPKLAPGGTELLLSPLRSVRESAPAAPGPAERLYDCFKEPLKVPSTPPKALLEMFRLPDVSGSRLRRAARCSVPEPADPVVSSGPPDPGPRGASPTLPENKPEGLLESRRSRSGSARSVRAG